MNVIDDFGNELNSEVKILTEEGMFGLVIESWGPKDRNRDYNRAVELIIERLKESGVKTIEAYLVSSLLQKIMPDIEARRIIIDNNKSINIEYFSGKEVRAAIGRVQGMFGSGNNLMNEKPTGNRTKRILFVCNNANRLFWESIVLNEKNIYLNADRDYEKEVAALYVKGVEKPEGFINPEKKFINQTTYYRDPKVKAWVLKKSEGKCECCGSFAPFKTPDGIPFLEVHHVVPLADGGADTTENCIAVCPNCHRAFHHSENRHDLVKAIYIKVPRLTATRIY
ncbi:HNH endonuclease signature motif containing protein [Franconibacter pulveris]|uniref:HNH endonuclease n=1 Tax=Franconibacter pulveris TaxID=435910 RepID=UPI0004955548|nr:HNH endonuclease signature motif containing protein [Franconibacter pulveris]